MKDVYLKSTIKHGGSCIVCGYLTANGVSDSDRIDGIMNAKKYKPSLIHLAIPSSKRLIGNGSFSIRITISVPLHKK